MQRAIRFAGSGYRHSSGFISDGKGTEQYVINLNEALTSFCYLLIDKQTVI